MFASFTREFPILAPCLLAQACQPLWLVLNDDGCNDSILFLLSLSRQTLCLEADRIEPSSRTFLLLYFNKVYLVPAASHNAVASNAHADRLM